MEPAVTIIVATRNRAPSLQNLLASLDRLRPSPISFEVLIVDNGSTDETPRILSQWTGPGRQMLRIEQPGRSRALNAAILAARGPVVAITDDDIVFDPGYVGAVWNFFSQHDCWAAQGSISLPPEVALDPELNTLLQLYESTVPKVEPVPGTRRPTLVGANMVARRDVLKQVGLFSEHLGPGAAGFLDDDDLAHRILAHGGWIGSMPEARVIHEVDPTRLTEEYFRRRHRLQGRSCYLFRKRGLFSHILPDLFKVGCDYAFFSLLRNSRRQYHARGRWYHYREMLNVALGQGHPGISG